MEGNLNLTKEEVNELIGVFNLEPMFTDLIITLNVEKEDNDLVLSENLLSETQYVIAKGSSCREIKEGDKILINLEKMMVKSQNPNNAYESLTSIKIDPIEFNGYTFGIIGQNIIKAKYKNEDND